MIYEVYKNEDCKFKKDGDVESEDIISLFEKYLSKEKGIHVYVDCEQEWQCNSLAEPSKCCNRMKLFLDALKLKIDGGSILFEKITDLDDIHEEENGYCMFGEIDLSSGNNPLNTLKKSLNDILRKLKITQDYSFGLMDYLTGFITLDDLKNIQIDGWVYIVFRVDYSFKDAIIKEEFPPLFEYVFFNYGDIIVKSSIELLNKMSSTQKAILQNHKMSSEEKEKVLRCFDEEIKKIESFLKGKDNEVYSRYLKLLRDKYSLLEKTLEEIVIGGR